MQSKNIKNSRFCFWFEFRFFIYKKNWISVFGLDNKKDQLGSLDYGNGMGADWTLCALTPLL